MSRVRVYQQKNPIFHVNEDVKKYDPAEYKLVYDEETTMDGCSVNDVADHFFEVTNLTALPGWHGHSMSVGDILEYEQTVTVASKSVTTKSMVICCDFGWMPVVWVDDKN